MLLLGTAISSFASTAHIKGDLQIAFQDQKMRMTVMEMMVKQDKDAYTTGLIRTIPAARDQGAAEAEGARFNALLFFVACRTGVRSD